VKKKQPKYIREFNQEIRREIARKARKRKREELAEVMTKDKAETYGDVYAIFNGLSKKAKDWAVLDRIFTLSSLGKNPTEIIKMMEPKK